MKQFPISKTVTQCSHFQHSLDHRHRGWSVQFVLVVRHHGYHRPDRVATRWGLESLQKEGMAHAWMLQCSARIVYDAYRDVGDADGTCTEMLVHSPKMARWAESHDGAAQHGQRQTSTETTMIGSLRHVMHPDARGHCRGSSADYMPPWSSLDDASARTSSMLCATARVQGE